jgi:hypothetical protein
MLGMMNNGTAAKSKLHIRRLVAKLGNLSPSSDRTEATAR